MAILIITGLIVGMATLFCLLSVGLVRTLQTLNDPEEK